MKLTLVQAAFIGFLCVGCESPQKASERQAQWSKDIEHARDRVLAQLPDLDAASREMIRTNAPSTPYVGLPFGGVYWFRWTICSNRVAVLSPGANPKDVRDAPVYIERLASKRPY